METDDELALRIRDEMVSVTEPPAYSNEWFAEFARRLREDGQGEPQPRIDSDIDACWLPFPSKLHPDTKELVLKFAWRLAIKLRKAEQKYGYSNGWKEPDWMDECRTKLREHVDKGDPLDVAAYCAFLMWHRESTASPQPEQASVCTDCGHIPHLDGCSALFRKPEQAAQRQEDAAQELAETKELLRRATEANSKEYLRGRNDEIAARKDASTRLNYITKKDEHAPIDAGPVPVRIAANAVQEGVVLDSDSIVSIAKDAARYRWLRDEGIEWQTEIRPVILWHQGQDDEDMIAGTKLDAAIDAALVGKGGEG